MSADPVPEDFASYLRDLYVPGRPSALLRLALAAAHGNAGVMAVAS
jgi:hypothetical protein